MAFVSLQKLLSDACPSVFKAPKSSQNSSSSSSSRHAKVVYCHSPQCSCNSCLIAKTWKCVNGILVHQGGLRGSSCHGCRLQNGQTSEGYPSNTEGHAVYDPRCRDCHIASLWKGVQHIYEQQTGQCLHLFSCERHNCPCDCDALDSQQLSQLDVFCSDCLLDSIWEGMKMSLKAKSILSCNPPKILMASCNMHGYRVYSDRCRACRIAMMCSNVEQLDATFASQGDGSSASRSHAHSHCQSWDADSATCPAAAAFSSISSETITMTSGPATVSVSVCKDHHHPVRSSACSSHAPSLHNGGLSEISAVHD